MTSYQGVLSEWLRCSLIEYALFISINAHWFSIARIDVDDGGSKYITILIKLNKLRDTLLDLLGDEQSLLQAARCTLAEKPEQFIALAQKLLPKDINLNQDGNVFAPAIVNVDASDAKSVSINANK